MKRLAPVGTLLLALALLASLPAWIGNSYYVNIASQVLLYAVFALGLNVIVGYAGLVSLGHAGLFGIAAYTGAILINAGHGHFLSIAGALVVTLAASGLFAMLALRGTGLGFVMITVALGQIVWGVAYRWISLTNGDNGVVDHLAAGAVRPVAGGRRPVLLGDARGVPGGPCGDRHLRRLAVRRQPARHARPAAADERARLQRLADPLPRLPVLRLLERRRRPAVPLLQPVRQPADRGAHRLGRGVADGDLRRHRRRCSGRSPARCWSSS